MTQDAKSTETPSLRLNLGCGFLYDPAYTNVDSSKECAPDLVWDLEKTPWPWQDDSVSEIRLFHVLEHLGQTSESYFDIWKEMWRVCRNGALVHIRVPHWHHENFYNDPTHLRPITPTGVGEFDQTHNRRSLERGGGGGAPFGLLHGIDFELRPEDIEYFYTQKVADQVFSGAISREMLEHLREHQNNISNEVRMTVRAMKPGRETSWFAAYQDAKRRRG